MFFALVILPIVAAAVAGGSAGAKRIRAGKDIRHKPTAFLPKRLVTQEEYEEYLETDDAERIREIDRKSTYRNVVYREAEQLAEKQAKKLAKKKRAA